MTSAPAATDDTVGPPAAASPGWVLPLLVLMLGSFTEFLDTTIVNVAISRIQNDFGATTDEVQWVANAYTMMLGVMVPLSGWLGDRFGLSRLNVIALLGFGAGSALCGMATSLNMLVAFRILQGIGGGILPVIALSILYRIVPRHKIGTAIGIYGLGVLFAPGIGPSLGGYLVEYFNWRWVFYVNVPIAIAGAIGTVLLLPQFPGGRASRFDLLGFVTVATGLFTLLLATSEGQRWGWTSYKIIILLLVSALSLALFVVIELEVAEPLMNVRLLRYWTFTNSLLLTSVLSIGLFGVMFYIPMLLQRGMGMPPYPAGLVMLPQALVLAVFTSLSGRIYERIGPRWLSVIGMLIVAVVTYWMHHITLDASRDQIKWLLVLRAVGLGIAFTPVFTSGLDSLPPALVPQGSAMNNLVRQVSSALGVAVFTALLTQQQTQRLDDRAALLLPGDTSVPHLGSSAIPDWLTLYALDQRIQLQTFVDSVDWLFIIVALLTAAAIILALFLPSGPPPASDSSSDTAAALG